MEDVALVGGKNASLGELARELASSGIGLARGFALTADAYRPALLTMVGILAVGFVANLLVRPVAERFHEKDVDEPLADTDSADASSTDRGTGERTKVHPALLTVAWLIVGVPLAYGVYQTLTKTLSLFG